MIDKDELIKDLQEECNKDIYKELPMWILKVIEKQPKCERDIPKKVKNCVRNMLLDGFETGECPICGRFTANVHKCLSNYCDGCGQKLDWSD